MSGEIEKRITRKRNKEQPLKISYEESNTSQYFSEKEDTWKPENWEVILDNIRKMRSSLDAPVDTMGCEKCVDEEELPEVKRFHTLISLMLSSQTKDETTHAAVDRLQKHGGLTVDNIIKTDEETLGKLIIPVGFWKTKAKHIKKTAEILKEQFNGDIPNTVELLCSLPGVGPKMAHLCMQCAWGITSGIGVDTHVHRISNRLKFVQKPTSTPEATRKSLESWLPFELWQELNKLLVGFGQQICRPVSPKCDQCLNNSLCPSANQPSSKKKKK